jgi:hypothetical protein
LITWVVTAGGGFVLLAVWLARDGMRQQGEGANRIRPPLIMSHFLLAAAGLVTRRHDPRARAADGDRRRP